MQSCTPSGEGAAVRHKAGTRGLAFVLVADDEEHVRNLRARLLDRQGYSVLSASDGGQALALVSDLGRPISVSMPGLSGADLIREARQLRPDLGVIRVSARVERPSLSDGVHYLPKPFTLASIVSKMREILP